MNIPRNTFCGQTQRREFLHNVSGGFASLALTGMLAKDGFFGQSAIAAPAHAKPKPLPGKAKSVIFLFMYGGPSHMDTFDYKPELYKLNDNTIDVKTFGRGGKKNKGRVVGPKWQFKPYGQCGKMVSDLFPHLGGCVDDIAFIHSMTADSPIHGSAMLMMNSGSVISGKPSLGSWVNYGLGSEAEDLPGFVVMTSVGGRNPQPIASRQWSAGFLPSRFQGVEFNATGDPVHYLRNPEGVSPGEQRKLVDAITSLDRHRNQAIRDPETDTRIAAYEMAFRMQASVPELMDVSREPQHILDMYGAKPGDGSYASNCLLARKLAEKGVRFIHLYHRGWDHHGDLQKYMDTCCGLTDKPTWALIQDLKQRGMLEDTLVIWGGEFGRTPMFQGKGGPGRDHHVKGFSMWMAGGGVKGGIGYGETDELGYHAVRDKVQVRDMHATMLHLLGINHQFFTVKHQGLDWKLTGVDHSQVVKPLLA